MCYELLTSESPRERAEAAFSIAAEPSYPKFVLQALEESMKNPIEDPNVRMWVETALKKAALWKEEKSSINGQSTSAQWKDQEDEHNLQSDINFHPTICESCGRIIRSSEETFAIEGGFICAQCEQKNKQ